MTSLRDFAIRMSTERDVPLDDMLAIVKTYAEQIGALSDHYDAEAEQLTDEGVAVLTEQLVDDEEGITGNALDDVIIAQGNVDRRNEELARDIDRRDRAIRQALRTGARVQAIADETRLSRARIYQIRDERR